MSMRFKTKKVGHKAPQTGAQRRKEPDWQSIAATQFHKDMVIGWGPYARLACNRDAELFETRADAEAPCRAGCGGHIATDLRRHSG
jgi:hypothetical protein